MRLLSTRELADALGASESSLKRWIDAGRISASRTDGGHRRVAVADAMRFIRDHRAALVRPEALGLPEVALAKRRNESFSTYLREGDHAAARGYLLARYLEGARVHELADGPIRAAMHELGELWHHGAAGIEVEHRGTDVCVQAVSQLRAAVPPPPDRVAPLAIGAAPAGDPYLLPSLLASATAQEAGMNTVNYGPDTPTSALEAAIARHRPALLWLSISTPLAPAPARALAAWLGALPRALAVVIGGAQAHTLGPTPERVHRAASMARLAELASAAAAASVPARVGP